MKDEVFEPSVPRDGLSSQDSPVVVVENAAQCAVIDRMVQLRHEVPRAVRVRDDGISYERFPKGR